METPYSPSALNAKKNNDEGIVESVLREWRYVQGNRGNWETQWREIAERVIPSHSRTFTLYNNIWSQGEKRTEHLFDSTASIALNRFSAILDSLLTPRNQTWHRIMASQPELNKDRDVRLWFDEVNRTLFKYRYAPKANFSSQNQQNYKSLGAYGTGCVFVDQLQGDPGIRYRNVHLGEIYFMENHQGMIDKALRHFPLNARQAIQKWGDKLPQDIKTRMEANPEAMYWFLHCVKPREDLDPTRKDYKGMPFASYYIAMEGKALLKEEGYTTFPYAISRYEQSPGEVYGRSPAMDVLPAIKTLNEEKKTLLKQGHRIVDPVLLGHDDGLLDSFSLRPGSYNAGGVDAQGRVLVHTLPTGNVQIGKELMDDERAIINDAFLVTLFQILTENPQMTATEVLERSREKGIIIAPTLGRQQSEYLGPMVERELDLLARQGLLPPMPGLLKEAQGEYRLEYDSPLSRAQRAEEASGIGRSVEFAINVATQTQNMEPLDHFNWDEIIPDLSEINGAPAKYLRDIKEVMAMRQGRAQQAQQQQAIQAGPAAAAMIKAQAVANKAG